MIAIDLVLLIPKSSENYKLWKASGSSGIFVKQKLMNYVLLLEKIIHIRWSETTPFSRLYHYCILAAT